MNRRSIDRALNSLRLTHAADVFTFTTSDELYALARLASRCPRPGVVLEVGSYLGASTCYLAAGLEGVGHIYCVDTWQNETMPEGEKDTFELFLAHTRPVSAIIHPIRKKTEDVTEEDVPQKPHLIFIDADHSYDAVKADFAKFAPFLAQDGTVAFHDCNSHVGVTRVIGEILASGRWRIGGHVGNLLWIQSR